MMRHGESIANLEHKFLGHGDWDLTEKGHRQAALTAAYLKNIPCDAVYASDLLRAFHTAEHTAAAKGMVVADPRLREIDGGEWEFVPGATLAVQYPQEYQRWREDFDNAVCPGGESVQALQQRIAAAVTDIAQSHPGQTVFLFSHAAAVRAMVGYCLGCPLRELDWPANASVTHLTYENGVFALQEYGRDDFMGDLTTTI